MLLTLLGLFLASCAGSLEVPGSSAGTDSTPATEPEVAETTTTRSPTPNPGEVDLVKYIATIEEILAGTSYEGEALDSPDVFLATGALFCDQLDAGISSDEVVTSYIETLTGGDVNDADDDDLTMAGAVLGTGLVTLCPHHLTTVGASS